MHPGVSGHVGRKRRLTGNLGLVSTSELLPEADSLVFGQGCVSQVGTSDRCPGGVGQAGEGRCWASLASWGAWESSVRQLLAAARHPRPPSLGTSGMSVCLLPCPLPAWLCTWGWGWGSRQGHCPARSYWPIPSESCPASPFCHPNSPFFSLRQCGRPNGQLPRRATDRVAGILAAAVRAPGHRRVCCGGRRGVPEAAGPQQAFLLSSRSSA